MIFNGDDLTDLKAVHFKPDYAYGDLLGNNYICHFTAFRKELLEKAGGGFRPEFDGSQDHDLILRLTEQAEHIVHIPKILYYWRAHKGSTAEAIQAKPYVIEAGKKAVKAHLDRLHLAGEVLDGPVPSMYRLKYTLISPPLVSILIPNKDHKDDLKRCIDSILNKLPSGLMSIAVPPYKAPKPIKKQKTSSKTLNTLNLVIHYSFII